MGVRAISRSGFEARLLIDATGPRGFLHREFAAPENLALPGMPLTESLYSHFTGVTRTELLWRYSSLSCR